MQLKERFVLLNRVKHTIRRRIDHLITHSSRFQQLLQERAALVAETTQLVAEKTQLAAENANLVAEKAQLLQEWQTWMPPGHFYSPIPDLNAVKQREAVIFGPMSRSLPGINLNESGQLDWLEKLRVYYADQPFAATPQPGLRYFFENNGYCYSDAIFLQGMIRHLQPRRIIEVGSGYSSCVMLDTNELFCQNQISCTFIDPFPQLLESLLKPDDRDRITIIPQPLQELDLAIFQDLSAGDILFIDSTHVAKVDSDVNYIFFQLLPSLNSGVYIHFHDIFYPFEYPQTWIYQGRAWNEDYFLRAFLQYNDAFEICLFNTFLEHFYEAKFAAEMPLCLKDRGGSIWLRKQ
jgi:Methyltransferase domain